MKRMDIVCAILLAGLLSLAGCAGGPVSPAPTPTTGTEAMTTATSSSTDTSSEGRGCVRRVQLPYWELDSLRAFDTLLSQADGYIYYYIFDDPPPGLEVVRVGVNTTMSHYNITFRNPENQLIQLFGFAMRPDLEEELTQGRFKEITVDGVTYYYHQNFTRDGTLYVSYFQWRVGDMGILVHPRELITSKTIRKYNELRKVEFNAGEPPVGLQTGRLLIGDLSKIKEVIRGCSEIHYHLGSIPEGKENDLLEP